MFLRDVRAYRENQLQSTGITPLFPFWDIPTPELARSMIAGDLRAKLVCVDSRQLAASFGGRDGFIYADFLSPTPASSQFVDAPR